MLAPLTPGFMVLQGNQLEDLRAVAVHWLASNPLWPLEQECILVQSNGIAQWLKAALAHNETGNGIAAAIDVQLPGRFIWQAFRSVFPELPDSSPFDKAPLTWRLYQLLRDPQALQAMSGEQAGWLAPLQGFLSADQDPRRCHQLAGKLADLYDQYQLYRADWLQAWEQGQDVLIHANGTHSPLPHGQRWQALLWRLLHRSINSTAADSRQPWANASRAHIHQQFIEACTSFTPDNRPPQLPRRVMVFSISSLPQQTLQLLHAISPFTQVMLFVTNPSQHYWGDLVEGKELLKREYRRIAERRTPDNLEPEDLHAYGHPLLASWGKQGRDFLHLLDEHDQPASYRQLFSQQRVDLFNDPGDGCLLHQLQGDILHLRPLAERQALHSKVDAQQDQSLQFLVAHSPQREVEILHDQLLASFAAARERGETLNARDILVMVPDINQYAPHIHAVFGRYAAGTDDNGGAADPRFLPYHISDQSQRQQNTLLIALEKLLHLPQARFTVSELSDLLDTPALRTRFGLEEADLPVLRRWIRGANIRWGLDAGQRASLDLPALEQNTWLAGLERMLLGFAAGNSDSWQGIEPYDEVAGLEAALLGPLSQLVSTLQQSAQTLAAAHSANAWLRVLEQLLQDFFSESSPADSWALGQLELVRESLQTVWQAAGLGDEPLPLEVVREELLAGLDQPGLSQKFLGGSINFATLMPMRAIPFTQLWLLGMNDKDYPRSIHRADFDLMANDYRPGDRSRREDDRYLFLEALLSARQRLVISWVGRDIRDNSERPPSVLVSQLRDHLEAGWHSSSATPLLQTLTTEHPLQPFSRSYFSPQRDPRLFTHAREWREVHDSTSGAPAMADDLDQLPAWEPQAPLKLGALASFLRNPVSHFYQQRLGIRWHDTNEESPDSEPFVSDGLESWQLRSQLLDSSLQQLARQPDSDTSALLQQQISRLQRTGALPVPPFADAVQTRLHEQLDEPLQRYQQLLASHPQVLPVQHPPAQLELDGGVADIRHDGSGGYLRIALLASNLHSGNSLKHYHLVRQWPLHLCAQLQQPVTTRLLGPATDISLAPMDSTTALQLLQELHSACLTGLQRPLPLPCKTAFAELEKPGSGRTTYEGDYTKAAERDETPGLQRFWPDYERLLADPLFLQYAEQLYRPLLEAVART